MTIEVIGILSVLVGLIGLYRPLSFTVIVFLCSTLLGASAATVLEALGGTNVQPAHLLLGFLVVRIFHDKRMKAAAKEGLTFGRPALWLLCSVVYCVISAYFMPRLFAGATEVFPVRLSSTQSVPLSPVMANLTQTIYFIGNFCCFIAIYAYAHDSVGKRVLGAAAVLAAALNLVFAGLDLLTYFTNTTELLSFIRNANYSMLGDSEVVGFKRIVGSFPEASSFGAVTLGYFAFVQRLWLLGIRTRVTGVLAALSVLALVFSTSTTAYVGLASFIILSYLAVAFSVLQGRATRQMILFLIVGPVVLVCGLIAIALNEVASDYVQFLVDTMVLNKMQTASGIERSMWNTQAIQSFLDTSLLGVGNGSTRASSFPLVVLANLGLIGSLLFGAFFLALLLSRLSVRAQPFIDDGYQQAGKAACIAILVGSTLAGTLIDLGLAFYLFAGLACATPRAVFLIESSRLARPRSYERLRLAGGPTG
jgi:hypothetical protein